MAEFLQILALYYLCDATALVRPMSAGEVQTCFDIYEQVKTYFVADFDLAPRGTLARHAQMSEAYLGFLAWQEANPALVEDMRADAMDRARGVAGLMAQ